LYKNAQKDGSGEPFLRPETAGFYFEPGFFFLEINTDYQHQQYNKRSPAIQKKFQKEFGFSYLIR
jgi:hypothetical protein